MQLQKELIDDLNHTPATTSHISGSDSAVDVFVIPTNEELVVARETKRLLEKR